MHASLAAYKEYVKWYELGWQIGRDGEAKAAIERALTLDSTWPQARLGWIGTFPKPEQDSLVRLEQRATGIYLPGDLDDLDAVSARLAGDREREYQAMKRRYRRDPAEYNDEFISAAYTTRRWREAARAGAGRNLPTFYFRRTGNRRAPLVLIYALHALGWHDSVLQVAREMRNWGPGEREGPLVWAITGEIITHAALHHVAVVDSLVVEAGAQRGTLPAMAYLRDWVAAAELRAHGNPAAARQTCNRWADKLVAETRGTGTQPDRRFDLMQALWCAGRDKEALAIEREFSGPFWRAIRAVREGNRALAYAIVDSLRAMPTPMDPSSGPAEDALRILCKLGDTTRAVAQFQETWRTGDLVLYRDYLWHRDADYDLIRNHPAVLALTRPKD